MKIVACLLLICTLAGCASVGTESNNGGTYRISAQATLSNLKAMRALTSYNLSKNEADRITLQLSADKNFSKKAAKKCPSGFVVVEKSFLVKLGSPSTTGTIRCKNKGKGKALESTLLKAQRRLIELGYSPGVADGLMGAKTRKAITSFQKDNGISESGKLDNDTVKKLNIK